MVEISVWQLLKKIDAENKKKNLFLNLINNKYILLIFNQIYLLFNKFLKKL